MQNLGYTQVPTMDLPSTSSDLDPASSSSLQRIPTLSRRASLSPDQISLAESMLQHDPPSLSDRLFKIKSRLSTAPDIAMLPDGGIVAADHHSGLVRLFDSEGGFDRTVVRGVSPLSITTNRSGMVFFTDHRKKNKLIQVYSMDGSFIARFGEDFKWKPRGLAISNKGLIVVGDASDTRQDVGLYTQDGKKLSSFGSKGSERTQFNDPLYIEVDLYDRILVSDHGNHAVKIWDDRGKFLGACGKKGKGEGELLSPRGLATDGVGNIYVADTGNRRVSVFSPDGRFIENILTAEDGISYPFGVAFGKKDKRLAVSMHTASERGSFQKLRVYQMEAHDTVDLL